MYTAALPSSNVTTTPFLNRSESIIRGTILSSSIPQLLTTQTKPICPPSDIRNPRRRIESMDSKVEVQLELFPTEPR